MSYSLLTDHIARTFPGVLTPIADTSHEYWHEDFSLHVQLCTDLGDEELRVTLLCIDDPGKATGRTLIDCLVQFCTDEQHILIADNVEEDAEEFWESVGFVPLLYGTRDYIYQAHQKYVHLY